MTTSSTRDAAYSLASIKDDPLLCRMPHELEALATDLPEAEGWVVGQSVSYDGSVLTVVEHASTGQTFSLSMAGERIELAQIHEDRMTLEGTFPHIRAALAALRQAVSQEQT